MHPDRIPNILFLSTPSARRATPGAYAPDGGYAISIHALREEGDQKIHRPAREPRISIHALREEGDPGPRQGPRSSPNFYPRPPRGGRPFRRRFTCSGREYFYPRPPRGGRPEDGGLLQTHQHFYPRPPRGGRHQGTFWAANERLFLSTPSARRATQCKF